MIVMPDNKAPPAAILRPQLHAAVCEVVKHLERAQEQLAPLDDGNPWAARNYVNAQVQPSQLKTALYKAVQHFHEAKKLIETEVSSGPNPEAPTLF
jgi:hypothetical protein